MKVSKRELVLVMTAISVGSEELTTGLVDMYDEITEMGIRTPKQWAYFLANVAHESGYFSRLEENLNYSELRLKQVWPARFKKQAQCKRCAHNPQALANHVYNGRMGNITGSNDGYFYRGRGLMQLTGKNNYKRLQALLGLNLTDNPAQVSESPYVAWLAAASYFCNRRYKGQTLLDAAEQGQGKTICKAINGGLNGYAEREAYARVCLNIFGYDEKEINTPIIRIGERGPVVRQMQNMLKALHYKIYKADGIYGKGTSKQVKRYQADNNLVPDGIVGGKTFLRLSSDYLLIKP